MSTERIPAPCHQPEWERPERGRHRHLVVAVEWSFPPVSISACGKRFINAQFDGNDTPFALRMPQESFSAHLRLTSHPTL